MLKQTRCEFKSVGARMDQYDEIVYVFKTLDGHPERETDRLRLSHPRHDHENSRLVSREK